MVRKILIELILLGLALGLTVEVIKSAVPYLPLIWLAVAAHYTWELATTEPALAALQKLKLQVGGNSMMAFVSVGLFGALLFCLYWWGLTSFFTPRITAYEAAENHGGKSEGGSQPGTTLSGGAVTAAGNKPGESPGVAPKPTVTPTPHETKLTPTPAPTPVPTPSLPAVELRFVHLESPALMIVNSSDAIARNIKWGVIVWNKNKPTENNPLQIPVSTFDWLKGHSEGGPQNLFGQFQSQLNPGDVLIGSAFVDCPECSRGSTYAVHIVYGQGGWFALLPGTTGGPLIPTAFTQDSRAAYFTSIENIPEKDRIPITPQ